MVCWEYDPVRAAVVEKNIIVKGPVKADGKAATIVIAPGNGTYEILSDQVEKKADDRAKMTSDVQVPQVDSTTQMNDKPRGDPEIAYVPPTH